MDIKIQKLKNNYKSQTDIIVTGRNNLHWIDEDWGLTIGERDPLGISKLELRNDIGFMTRRLPQQTEGGRDLRSLPARMDAVQG